MFLELKAAERQKREEAEELHAKAASCAKAQQWIQSFESPGILKSMQIAPYIFYCIYEMGTFAEITIHSHIIVTKHI